MKGYVKDKDWNVLYKLDLPSDREHLLNLKEGEEFVATNDLSGIGISSLLETEEKKVEILIFEKTRELAIAELTKEGKLDAEGKLKEVT